VTGKRRAGKDPVGPPPPEPGQRPAPAAPAGPPAESVPPVAQPPVAPPPVAEPPGASPPVAPLPPLAQPPVAPPPVAQPVPAEVVWSQVPTRREARRARKGEQRRRVGLIAGAAAVVVALIVGLVVVLGGHKSNPHHTANASEQTTLLLQIQGPDGTAVGSALLAHDDSATGNQGLEVLIPGRVITDTCGHGTQNFDQVLSLPDGAESSREAVSSMLNGVTVDGSLVLTTDELAALVDKLGGITVQTVDTNVVTPAPGGGSTVLVPQGSNVPLNGKQAVEYATYRTSADEPAAAQLPRLQQVIDATLTKLSSDETVNGAMLRELGPAYASSLGVDRLATLLTKLSGDVRSPGGWYPTDLPTTVVEAGGSPSYRINDAESDGVPALVHGQLAASLPASASEVRPSVLLLNGVGTPGLVETACSKLAANGLSYAGANNAPTFSDTRNSTILIKSDADVALGEKVAKALGLPDRDLAVSDAPENIADVIVTLGADYARSALKS
jgi:anionic cell wall polymer biosynthesis LytR-Cps2A-Psr (LCP) family protein